MTIYLAICDDNIADRKQSERLLEREKDKRLKENYDVLYIDSFGSEEALLKTPIKYDMFFVDMTATGSNGMELAKALRKKGVTAPIVLCSSTIDYSAYVSAPNDIIFIEKPITAGQISHLIDVALDFTKSRIPLVEIRCQKDTSFVKHTDIVRARKTAKFRCEVTLADGTYLDMMDSIDILYATCEPYGCFIKCGKDIININHIKAPVPYGFRLDNEDIVKYSPLQRSKILSTLASNIHNEQ